MIKREKKKTSKLKINPYMYYMTNWGFIQPTPEEDGENRTKE